MKYVFKPSIGNCSDDAFMAKSSVELIKEQDIQIPIIFGTTNKEGIIQTEPKLLISLESFNNDPIRMIPYSVNVDSNSSEALKLGNEIKNFYFGNKQIGEDTVENYFDLVTDLRFLVPQTISNELHARYQPNSSQYLYEFRFDGDLNLFKKILKMEKYKGASHIDDMFYLFGQKGMKLDLCEDSLASKMRATMCKLWSNFAKCQNPTPEFNNPLNTTWNSTEHNDQNSKTATLNYLIIDEEIKMELNVNADRVNFWRNIYENYNKEFSNLKYNSQ